MSTSTLPVITLVRSIKIGLPVEQRRYFVECIPSNLMDVVSESLNQTADVGYPADDACTGQTLHHAIICAQGIGSRLVAHVEPQNLLFVFGQSAKALAHLALESPLAHHGLDERKTGLGETDAQQCHTGQECESKPLAIVLCHVSNTELLREIAGREQQEGQDHGNCYQVAWSELKKLKSVLEQVGNHCGMVAVQGGAA